MSTFFAIPLVFAAYFFGGNNALSCYNYTRTLNTDEMNAVIAAVLKGTYTVNMSRLEVRLPNDAPLVPGCDACVRVSGRYLQRIGPVNITVQMLSWQCYNKSADDDGDGGVNTGMQCGPMFPAIGSSSELICTEMSMMTKQAGGVTTTCSCCSDGCNRRRDCGVREDSQLTCPASGQVSIANMTVNQKCRHLRQAMGMLNDICDAATANTPKSNLL